MSMSLIFNNLNNLKILREGELVQHWKWKNNAGDTIILTILMHGGMLSRGGYHQQ